MAKKDERHFALKETVKDFAGASLAFGPDGETVDIKARLDNGGGTITTDDPDLADALAGHDALKEVSSPSKAGSAKSEKE